MSFYAAEQLLAIHLSKDKVNAKVTALNTTYGFAGHTIVPPIAKVYTADLIADMAQLDTPALAIFTGAATTAGKIRQHGFREYDIPVLVAVAPAVRSPAQAHRDVQVYLEAIVMALEDAIGQKFGSTERAIQQVKDLSWDTVKLTVEGSPVTYGGSAQATLVCITRGV